VAPFVARARLGSVAALLLRPGELEIDSAGLVADRTLAGFPRFHGQPPSAVLSAAGTEPALTGPAGAAAAFRRAAWVQVGGLDESIFAYLEDLDLALRLRAAGWETSLALDAVALHVGSATLGHRSAEQRRKIGHARGYLLRRYGVLSSRTAPRALLTEAIVAAGDALFARDLQAVAGRLEGWRAAAPARPRQAASAGRATPERPFPPPEAIDPRIGFLDSLRLRRGIYLAPARGQ
jgi:N-acetylglucosaminyl-diphospho-decaprenol L-rhamnosyltransferase